MNNHKREGRTSRAIKMKLYLIGLVCFSLAIICGADDTETKLSNDFAAEALEANQGLTLKDKIKDSVFGGLQQRAFHEHNIRKTQGHFGKVPFVALYQYYVNLMVFGRGKDSERMLHKDDPANHAASGSECMVFFQIFLSVEDHRVDKLEEFVKLDSCLGYLYDVEEGTHERDIAAHNIVARQLNKLRDNEELKSIYYGTQIDSWDRRIKNCVADLFKKLFELRNQFDKIDCNNHYLAMLEEFASCNRGRDPANPLVSREMIANDSYLNRIYQLVREHGQKCYHSEIELLNRASRSDYANENIYRFRNAMFNRFDRTTKRSYEDMMSQPMLNLLRVCSRPVEQEFQAKQQMKSAPLMSKLSKKLEIKKKTVEGINLKWFQQMFTSLQAEDASEQSGFIRFLFKALRKFANEKYEKLSTKEKNADPTGVTQYQRFVDDLCVVFRSNSKPGSFDYATSITRIVGLLEFEEVFGLDANTFLTDIVNRGRDTAPIYTGVYMCHILTLTKGWLATIPGSNPEKKSYQIGFVEEFDRVKRRFWPASEWY